MPTLHWIGKEKVINHHQEVPFRILEKQYTFTNGIQTEEKEKTSENKIIHGDNLEALKSLLPEYEGKIKCIYIDPPYNTGKEDWVYNDNVNDPKIKKWLGQVVGKEIEDLSRHDKWLCMIYPRLKLLHKLLSEEGLLIIHIDENEYHNLILVLEEIFGKTNNLGSIVWDKKNPKGDAKKISYQHEIIVVFSKQFNLIKGSLKKRKKNAEKILNYAKKLYNKLGKTSYPDDILNVCKKYKIDKVIFNQFKYEYDLNSINEEFKQWITKQDFSNGEKAYKNIDIKGNVYRTVSMAWPNKETAGKEYFIPLTHPTTKKECPVPERGWRNPPKTMKELLNKGLIIFGDDEKKQPERKYLLKENLYENVSSVISYGGSDDKFQKQINIKLENPKPFIFSTDLIDFFSDTDSIILDSFAGSGTTAHAVLNLNKKDGGNRKFILVEMEDYAESITAERVKRVISGYGEGNKAVEGTGGDFSYYELGKPLFLEENILNEEVEEEKIREYIWYSEVKTLYQKQEENYLLGKQYQTAYYFYYDKEKLTTLDENFLRTLKTKAEQYIIYADNCLLDADFMNTHSLIFKKIPRDITRF